MHRKEITMSDLEIIKIGKYEFTVLFPDLPSNTTAEEDEALKRDIEQNGILAPIRVDEKLGIIDGVRRAKIAAELGLKVIPFVIHPNLSEQDKKALAITLNANRRNWSKEDKQKIAITLRQEQFSLRRIADVLGVGSETVRRWVTSSCETVDLPDTVVGVDGVERPAKMPRKPVIFARSVSEAKELSDQLRGSDATEHLKAKIIYGRDLNRELHNAHHDNPPDNVPPETVIGNAKLQLGDFREKCEEIEDESINIIDTDPPYGEVFIQLYEDLAELASRILKPGGLLLSYCGNMYIPQIHRIMGEHLEYLWTFAVRHTGGNTPIHNVKLFQSFKPLICYYKPPLNISWTPFVDMVSGGKSKSFHKWEQPESESEYFLSHLFPESRETITILDPMMGSGSVILAGINLGMACIGVDIDTSAYATALQRVEHLQNKLKTDVA